MCMCVVRVRGGGAGDVSDEGENTTGSHSASHRDPVSHSLCNQSVTHTHCAYNMYTVQYVVHVIPVYCGVHECV